MQSMPNLHTIEHNYVFLYIYGGHFEYFKLLKGGNMPPTCHPPAGLYREYCVFGRILVFYDEYEDVYSNRKYN